MRNRKPPEKKPKLKERIVEGLEMPKEVLLNTPFININGDREFVVENYKGIIEYEAEVVRVNTSIGIISIVGARLEIKSITDDELLVSGKISNISFN